MYHCSFPVFKASRIADLTTFSVSTWHALAFSRYPAFFSPSNLCASSWQWHAHYDQHEKDGPPRSQLPACRWRSA